MQTKDILFFLFLSIVALIFLFRFDFVFILETTSLLYFAFVAEKVFEKILGNIFFAEVKDE